MFQSCPEMELRRDVREMHVYALSKWALDILVEHRNLSSLSIEFLPFLARKQFRLAEGMKGSEFLEPKREERKPPIAREENGASFAAPSSGLWSSRRPLCYRPSTKNALTEKRAAEYSLFCRHDTNRRKLKA